MRKTQPTITVSFEVQENRTPSGLLVCHDIVIDGVYRGWVDMDNRRVTIVHNGAWVEVTCKRKRSGIKSYWLAARKVFPGNPSIGPAGQKGKCITEGEDNG